MTLGQLSFPPHCLLACHIKFTNSPAPHYHRGVLSSLDFHLIICRSLVGTCDYISYGTAGACFLEFWHFLLALENHIWALNSLKLWQTSGQGAPQIKGDTGNLFAASVTSWPIWARTSWVLHSIGVEGEGRLTASWPHSKKKFFSLDFNLCIIQFGDWDRLSFPVIANSSLTKTK